MSEVILYLFVKKIFNIFFQFIIMGSFMYNQIMFGMFSLQENILDYGTLFEALSFMMKNEDTITTIIK